jgi:OFA family oxalate/formate antiporter-like MFS transporter
MPLISKDKRGFLAVIASSLVIFWPGAFIFGFPGVMGPHWQQMFHVGRGAIGSTLFFTLVPSGIFMFFVGRWQEKVGIKRMMTIGSILCGFSLLIIAYAPKLHWLYLWAFLMGTSSCFIYIPALTTVQRWYPERRGLVSGIVNMMFVISAAIMSPVFNRMFDSMGYVSMNIVLAMIALSIGMIAAQFTEAPESIYDTQLSISKRQSKAQTEYGRSLTVKESLRTKSFWFLWVTWAFQGAAGMAMVTLSVAFGLSKGFTMNSAVALLTAFNVTSALGRIVTGYLSDIVGRNLAMSLSFLAAGCAYFVMPHVTSMIASAVFSAIIGFAFGTLFAVSAPLATDCFGLKHFGPIYGLVFTGYGFLSGLLGPSLSGYLLDITQGNFVIVFIYLGLFCFISSILIRFVIPPHPKSSL